jgi:hypothetical protein
MTVVDDESGASRTIEFQHHVHEDTPEGIGEEMQEEYHISDTDRDLVTALIIESLAGYVPSHLSHVKCRGSV